MGCTVPHRKVPAYGFLLMIPFRLNSLMVFTVFCHIMEKGWKERSIWHCVLATYCSSGARSEQQQLSKAAGGRDRQTLGSWRRLFVQGPLLLPLFDTWHRCIAARYGSVC